MTKPRRDRRTVLDELATAMVDLTAATLRARDLVSELDGIDSENAKISMLRAEPEPLYLSMKAAAKIARCSVETLKKKAAEHKFGWRPIGASGRPGHWIVVRDDLLEWLRAPNEIHNFSMNRRIS